MFALQSRQTLGEGVAKVEERVDDIEQAISKLALAQVQTETLIQQLTRDVLDFKREMSDFKKEMSQFKREMSDFKREAEADR